MTSYEFYRAVAEILSEKNADGIFDYIIHSMDDDGGFLRTRWCYWDKTLQDWGEFGDIKTALITLRSPFDFENNTEYYTREDGFTETLTALKMQLFYYDLSNKQQFDDEMEWSANLRYSYPIKIDMVNRSFEILPKFDILQSLKEKMTDDK